MIVRVARKRVVFFFYGSGDDRELHRVDRRRRQMCKRDRHIVDGHKVDLPLGKVVCVGRNYAAHARELNNPVPAEPVLFIKPNTALAPLGEVIFIPAHLGECHFETEMSILIGQPLTQCTEQQAQQAILGVGIGLDLTLRDLQQQLKDKSLPWEKAKSFDGACPASEFISPDNLGDLQQQQIRLRLKLFFECPCGEVVQ